MKSINDFWLKKVKLRPGAERMSRKPIKEILLVEDNPGDALLLREMLRGGGLAKYPLDARGVYECGREASCGT